MCICHCGIDSDTDCVFRLLDLGHYMENFRRITGSMEALGDARVDGWLSKAMVTSGVIPGLTILLGTILVALEWIICSRTKKGEDE